MHYHHGMRTTLSIDDDVLLAAKGLAAREKRSLGEVVSELARRGLAPSGKPPKMRNGVPLMPVRKGAGRASLELVNRLRDDTP